MQIWYDPSTMQVMAVYSPGPYAGLVWADSGFLAAQAPPDMPRSRDLIVTVEDGVVTGWAPSVNPVQPHQPTPDVIDTATLNKMLTAEGSALRGLALLVLDEMNLHAARITAILDAADTATSLATFKTAMAAINDVPQRTTEQLKTALKAKMRSR